MGKSKYLGEGGVPLNDVRLVLRGERGVVLQHNGGGVRREVSHLLPRLQQPDPRLPPLPQRRKLPVQRPVLGQEHLREQRHVRVGINGAQGGQINV